MTALFTQRRGDGAGRPLALAERPRSSWTAPGTRLPAQDPAAVLALL